MEEKKDSALAIFLIVATKMFDKNNLKKERKFILPLGLRVAFTTYGNELQGRIYLWGRHTLEREAAGAVPCLPSMHCRACPCGPVLL